MSAAMDADRGHVWGDNRARHPTYKDRLRLGAP